MPRNLRRARSDERRGVDVDHQAALHPLRLLGSIDRDGMMSGYDLPVIASVAQSIKIPVTAAGGAATAQDFRLAVCSAGASAVAAGSMFVFCGKSKGFLINVPAREEIVSLFQNAFSL